MNGLELNNASAAFQGIPNGADLARFRRVVGACVFILSLLSGASGASGAQPIWSMHRMHRMHRLVVDERGVLRLVGSLRDRKGDDIGAWRPKVN